ncbi:MAG: GntR family transcriptional regulator [Chloroflexota bacterium]|nr:GntR family transcriptional regulator [Chloroflexota bacterium]
MGTQVFNQVPHKSLREAALSAIRQAISGGKLKPGQRLVESDIAEQMGISRAPVREALRQLETEGLVVSESHRGTFVTKVSATDLWEIYTLRAAIEGLAVRLVTEQASEETQARLQQAVADMTQAAHEGDLSRLAALDMAFHETLCRASGHSRLLATWLSMTTQIRTFIDLTSTLYLPADKVVRLHTEVVEHIQNGRAEEASRALARHILETGKRICQEQGKT